MDSRIADGTFITDTDKAYYVYELTMNGRTQTGIAACASIDDYNNNIIKKHENTRLIRNRTELTTLTDVLHRQDLYSLLTG